MATISYEEALQMLREQLKGLEESIKMEEVGVVFLSFLLVCSDKLS